MIMSNKCSVLLDTSFFIRLFNPNDALHNNAKEYYKYFLEHDIVLKISTIAIAEFCVRGDITDLPLRAMQIVPFNFTHAERAGEFMRLVLKHRSKSDSEITRVVIPNDTKMFAQADLDDTIDSYVSADVQAKKVIALLKEGANPRFSYIDITTPCSQTFAFFPF